MKLIVVFLTTLLVQVSALAVRVVVPQLPTGVYADTEVSTNVPLPSATAMAGWKFTLEMGRAATSNSVQVAFGRDEDGNGELSPSETTLVVGRNADRLFVENPMADVRFESAVTPSHNARNAFTLDVGLTCAGVPSGFKLVDDEGVGHFSDWATEPPGWLFDPRWNLCRVTTRGPDAALENLCIAVAADGTILRFR